MGEPGTTGIPIVTGKFVLKKLHHGKEKRRGMRGFLGNAPPSTRERIFNGLRYRGHLEKKRKEGGKIPLKRKGCQKGMSARGISAVTQPISRG